MLASYEVELLESVAEELGVDKAVQLLSEYSRMFKERAVKYDIPPSFNDMLIQARIQVSNNKFLEAQLDDFAKSVMKHIKKPVP